MIQQKKGQASIEYIILLGMFIGIIGFFVVFGSDEAIYFLGEKEASDSAKTLVRTADIIGAMGPGSSKLIQIRVPREIVNAYVGYKYVKYQSGGTGEAATTDYVWLSKAPTYGFLSSSPGRKYMLLRANENGHVEIIPFGRESFFEKVAAYYSFEQSNASSIIESRGYDTYEVFHNSTCDEYGYSGQGCHFNGSEIMDLQSIENAINKSSGGVSAWIRITNPSDGLPEEILSFYASSTELIRISKGAFGLRGTYTTGGTPTTVTTGASDQWQHVAMLWDDSLVLLYINGNFITSAQKSGSISQTFQQTYIGAEETNTTFFTGDIDELIVYSRAPTADEIKMLSLSGRRR